MSTLEKTKTIYDLIQKEWKLLLTLFVAGVLFYIYPICHQAITVDNEVIFEYDMFGRYLESKRWGITLLQKLFFMRTFVPCFWIVTNVAILSLAALICCDIFKFRTPWLNYLLGLLIISFPQYHYMMKFALTSDGVGVGILLIILGLRQFLIRSSWKSYLGTILYFIGALSIYESVIFIPLVLFLCLSISQISEKKLDVHAWLREVINLGIITATSYILFHYISIAILLCYGMTTDPSPYFTNMFRWGKDPAIEIVHRIHKLIWNHWRGKDYLGEDCFVLVWIPFVVLCLYVLREKIPTKFKALAIILLIMAMIAPFSQIILLGDKQPPRVFFAQAFLFASMWCLALQRLPKIKPELVLTCLTILYVHNGYRVTQSFHYDTMLEEAEKNLAMRIISRIDDMELSLENHRILIIGKYDIMPQYLNNKWSFNTKGHPVCLFSSSNFRTLRFLHIHGFTKSCPNYPSRQQINNLLPIVKSMPVWPAKDSIRLEDGVIIVKLGNNYNANKDFPDYILPKK